MNDDDLSAMRKRVQRLVYMAAGGKIDEAELGRYDTDLREIGLDSLGYLNLLEGLERTLRSCCITTMWSRLRPFIMP